MKTSRAILLASLLFSLPVASQDFEGTVVFSVTGPQGSQKFEYHVKGDLVRMEFERAPGMTMAMIFDTKSGVASMLMPDNKMYMELNLKDMPRSEPAGTPEFRKTGKTEKILGYACEQIVITQGDIEAEMWATKGLGRFASPAFTGQSNSPALKKIDDELVSKGYFPLKMVTKQAGEGEARMEALSVTRKSLSKDLFVIPAGYTKMQMPPRQ